MHLPQRVHWSVNVAKSFTQGSLACLVLICFLVKKRRLEISTIHLTNKTPDTAKFKVRPQKTPGVKFIMPIQETQLESLADQRIPIFVEVSEKNFTVDFPVTVEVTNLDTGDVVSSEARFLGP